MQVSFRAQVGCAGGIGKRRASSCGAVLRDEQGDVVQSQEAATRTQFAAEFAGRAVRMERRSVDDFLSWSVTLAWAPATGWTL